MCKVPGWKVEGGIEMGMGGIPIGLGDSGCAWGVVHRGCGLVGAVQAGNEHCERGPGTETG
jgi:hypothetical protein